jgi:hypothetical protein
MVVTVAEQTLVVLTSIMRRRPRLRDMHSGGDARVISCAGFVPLIDVGRELG